LTVFKVLFGTPGSSGNGSVTFVFISPGVARKKMQLPIQLSQKR